ncbi:hypothetical protein INR49_017967 [Caranx melampygus]|nr:hypothetical protein INR49_017967 [Caranx melampygus]
MVHEDRVKTCLHMDHVKIRRKFSPIGCPWRPHDSGLVQTIVNLDPITRPGAAVGLLQRDRQFVDVDRPVHTFSIQEAFSST